VLWGIGEEKDDLARDSTFLRRGKLALVLVEVKMPYAPRPSRKAKYWFMNALICDTRKARTPRCASSLETGRRLFPRRYTRLAVGKISAVLSIHRTREKPTSLNHRSNSCFSGRDGTHTPSKHAF